MTFVDASALCAILLGEPDGEELLTKLLAARAPLTSPVAVYETITALAKSLDGDVAGARRRLARLMEEVGVQTVPIGDAERELALDAFDRYGKGRHPAQLNMGDCFAYACARTHGAALLFKGDDFALTDIAVA